MKEAAIKKDNQYFAPLDTLRFVAIFLVLMQHWLPEYEFVEAFPFGDLGVDLFFVLSGFLITGILLGYRDRDEELKRGHGYSLKTFFIRRILRIFPIYWVVVIVTALANKGQIVEAFGWNMAYLSNFYVMELGEFPGNFGHFWSLSVEEQFYILWPFIIFFLPKKHLLKVFGLFVLIAIAFRYGYYDATHNWAGTIVATPSCFDAFGLGGILAYLARYRMELLKRILKFWWLLVLPITFYILLKTNFFGKENYYLVPTTFRLIYSMVGFCVIGTLCYANLGFMHKILEFKWFLFFGQISYGMYLLHNFVPGFLLGLPLPESDWVRFPVYFVALVAISWIARMLIERPFNNLKKRFIFQ